MNIQSKKIIKSLPSCVDKAFNQSYLDFKKDIFSGNIEPIAYDEKTGVVTIFDSHQYWINPKTHKLMVKNISGNHNWWNKCKTRKLFNSRKGWLSWMSNALTEKFFVLTKSDPNKDFTSYNFLYLFLLGNPDSKKATYYTSKLAKLIWTILDKDDVKLTKQYFGASFNIEQYNYTVSNKSLMQQISKETPNLTRLVGYFLFQNKVDVYNFQPFNSFNNPDLTVDYVGLIKTYLCNLNLNNNSLNNDLLIHKNTSLNNHLSEAGWRYISHLTTSCINIYIQNINQFNHFNFLADNHLKLSYSMFKWFMGNTSIPYKDNLRQYQNFQVFMKLAHQVSLKKAKQGMLKNFIFEELSLTWDWFNHENKSALPNKNKNNINLNNPFVIAKNESWASLQRKQNQWNQELLQIKIDNNPEYNLKSWNCLIDPFTLNNIKVTPLTNMTSLILEGQTMMHCVSSYGNKCISGTSQIFRLDANNEHATLEITSDSRKKSWRVAQVRGPKNKLPSKKLTEMGQLVANLYSKESRKN